MHTDPPFNQSAFALQGYYLAQMLKHAGHNVTFVARCQLDRVPAFEYDGFKIYSAMGYEGIEGAAQWSKKLDADMTISLGNGFNYQKEFGRHIKNWFPYFPVEREPILRTTLDAVKRAKMPLCMSIHGVNEYKNNGINAWYLPHVVDLNVFKPGDGLENEVFQDRFVVGMIAANNHMYDRKGFDIAFNAFSKFKQEHSDAILFCHTDVGNGEDNIDLAQLASYYGLILDHDIYFTDIYGTGEGYSNEFMARLYNTLDLMIMPSRAEGFGVPLIESQACGVPVIATNYAAMKENVFNGLLIEYTSVFNPTTKGQGHEALARVDDLEEAMNCIYDNKKEFSFVPDEIKKYDINYVYQNNLLPLIDFVESETNHDHQFSSTFLHSGLETLQSCKFCTTAQVIDGGFVTERMNVFDQKIHGIKLELTEDPMNKIITREMVNYGIENLPLTKEDKILDIGAHVGIFSITMAKLYPQVNIEAYEPVKENFEKLVKNIKLNGVKNVIPHNYGITMDARNIYLAKTSHENSGSFREGLNGGIKCDSVSMKMVMNDVKPTFIKIDCEGFEKELLINSGILEELKKVKYIRGELHKKEEANEIIDFIQLIIDNYKWSASYG